MQYPYPYICRTLKVKTKTTTKKKTIVSIYILIPQIMYLFINFERCIPHVRVFNTDSSL